MDTNMTFRIDSDIKKQMAAICDSLGMTVSTAFNIFANAFVRAKGIPFPVSLKEEKPLSKEALLADTDSFLNEYAEDNRRLAK